MKPAVHGPFFYLSAKTLRQIRKGIQELKQKKETVAHTTTDRYILTSESFTEKNIKKLEELGFKKKNDAYGNIFFEGDIAIIRQSRDTRDLNIGLEIYTPKP